MKKTLSIILAALLLLPLFACANGKNGDTAESATGTLEALATATAEASATVAPATEDPQGEETQPTEEPTDAPTADPATPTPAPAQTEPPVEDRNFAWTPVTARKVGSIDVDGKIDEITAGGIIWKNGSKYGVMTLDGKHFTGTIYEQCKYIGSGFFSVAAKAQGVGDSAEDMNCVGVIDAEGNEILPTQYAYCKRFNARYIMTIEVNRITLSESDCLFYTHDGYFSMQPSQGDTLYAGVWKAYDTARNRFVPGVSGTKPYSREAYGPYIRYFKNANTRVVVDSNGQEIDENSFKHLEDDYVVIEKTMDAQVFDAFGNVLFSYDPTRLTVIAHHTDGTFIAKLYDDQNKYAALNEKGEIVAAELDSEGSYFGGMIKNGRQLLDVDGNVIIEVENQVLGTGYDDLTGEIYFAIYEDTVGRVFVFFDANGKEIWRGRNEEPLYIDIDNTLISKKDDSYNRQYLCYVDGTFSIDGLTAYVLLVRKAIGNSRKALVDVRFNDEILRGYLDYTCVCGLDGNTYAAAQRVEGGYDIYVIEKEQ